MGEQGAVYAEMDGESGICPATRVEVQDTTGAGDAFFAGAAIGLTYGKTLGQSCAIGARLAASVIAPAERLPPVPAGGVRAGRHCDGIEAGHEKLRECGKRYPAGGLPLAGIPCDVGPAFLLFCENAWMDAATFPPGGACAPLAVGGSAGTGQLPAAEGAAPGAVGLSCRSSLV
ncbi:MAG: PfkB family carbohydrate kinase [Dysosmobacter sp.]